MKALGGQDVRIVPNRDHSSLTNKGIEGVDFAFERHDLYDRDMK